MSQLIGFGNGHDGSPAVSGTKNTYASCTGTSAATSLTTTLSASANDIILIHQTQGTGAGQWELNKVTADAGATLTLGYPLSYTYASGAQAVLVPQYTGGTLSGAVTATSWAGSSGGIIAIMSSGALIISGSLKVEGTVGGSGKDGAGSSNSGGGFYGGYYRGIATAGHGGEQGEGTDGTETEAVAANANGGGGGILITGFGRSGGGGGGNGATGSTGEVTDNATAGIKGATAGNAALTSMVMGGGGGGSQTSNSAENVGSGASGGGIILVIAKTLTITGTISCNGAAGGSGTLSAGGGGSAGGSILVKAQVATLGTSKITASAGSKGTTTTGAAEGGAGGVGRIRCDYYSGVTGTTSPALSSAQNTSLTSQVYTGMI